MLAARTHAALAIVLAAGHGRRMGMPKALLEIEGVTLLERHVARLGEIGCRSILVVVRPELMPRLAHLRDTLRGGVRLVAARTASQAESLSVGAGALGAADAPEDDDIVLVTPVDLVPPRASTLRGLLTALRPGIDAVTPTFRGKGGHPVVLRFHVLRARATASPWPLKEILDALRERRERVAVDDAAVLGDLDVPADLASVCVSP